MKNIIIPLFIIAFLQAADAQTYRQYMNAADEEFAGKNYYAAMKFYREAMTIEGEQPEVMYKYAESAREFQAYTFADTAYTKVLASEKAKEYPLAKYWLARVKKRQGKYEEAQTLFRQFADEHPSTYSDYTEKAREEVETLTWAINAINQADENVTVEHLGNGINSPNLEYAPWMNGNDLYYSSMEKEVEGRSNDVPRPQAQVLRSKNTSRKGEAVEFNEEKRHTNYSVFNKDKTRVYYTICDWVGETADTHCEIYYRSVDEKGNYGAPVRLPNDINREGSTASQPSIAFDEMSGMEWLFFVSDRPGGVGKMDIWMSVVGKDSSFSKPLNLGEVNTPENDETPFYHSLSKTLYFSADGRQGFGGFDIYKCLREGDFWGEIEHLPAPYNSSYNDTHFWMNETRSKGFFSSSRIGSIVLDPEYESCCGDLYSFTVQVVDLDIFTFNEKNKQALNGVTVELKELAKQGELNLATTTNPTGNDFNFQLKKGSKYVVLASKGGFLPVTDTIDLTLKANKDQRQIERKLYLVPEEVELHVTSFNKRTMNPLKGVEVRLVLDGSEVNFKKNEVGNNVDFTLERGKLYQLIGAKVAYFSDTAYIDLRFDKTTTDIDQKLLLRPKEIEDFPPLVIYFDNDQPNPKTRKSETEFSYEETVKEYLARKEIFRKEYVKSLVGQDSFVASNRINAFFDREVTNGYLSLDVFTENVLQIMQDDGFKVELVIQGFTSPRAGAEYNFNLSQRRSDCLKNHFETWHDGVLKPFIERGMLVMQVVGYGEKLAPQYISDKLDDERESIYSVTASFERKVAIIGARRVADN